MKVLPIATLLAAVTCVLTGAVHPASGGLQAPEKAASQTSTSAAGTLTASRTYIPPGAPLLVKVNSSAPLQLVLADFIGATVSRSDAVQPGMVDIRPLFATRLATPGTYVLYAVPTDADHLTGFVGTPLVVDVRTDARRGAPPGPMLYRFVPLQYAQFKTTAGDLTLCFYYDTAPNTVAAIEGLVAGGFYDGLDFFRVEKNFVVQTGDPRNNGTGGPGFFLDAEFSDRLHFRGVVSLARLTDPTEAPGISPRTEFANSGGSQFFICTNNDSGKQLNRRYTAFGRLVDDTTVLDALANTPIEEGSRNFHPKFPPRVLSARLVDVTAGDDPYTRLRIVEGGNGASDLGEGPSAANASGGATTMPTGLTPLGTLAPPPPQPTTKPGVEVGP